MTTKPVTITIDGASHTVELSDAAAILVGQLQSKVSSLTTDLAAANTMVGTHAGTISTRDGEIVVLKKQVADATLTPDKLDAMVADREAVVTKAKAIFDALDPKGKSVEVIRKEAVTHKLGDAAANMDDNAISGAFAALTVTADATDTMREGIRQINTTVKTNDAHNAYQARLTRTATAA